MFIRTSTDDDDYDYDDASNIVLSIIPPLSPPLF